jgi:BarA-like signal transduction histidine kinase
MLTIISNNSELNITRKDSNSMPRPQISHIERAIPRSVQIWQHGLSRLSRLPRHQMVHAHQVHQSHRRLCMRLNPLSPTLAALRTTDSHLRRQCLKSDYHRQPVSL